MEDVVPWVLAQHQRKWRTRDKKGYQGREEYIGMVRSGELSSEQTEI